MNILHISTHHYWPPLGGTERYLWNLCEGLDRLGQTTILVYDRGPNEPTGRRTEYHLPGCCAYVANLASQIELRLQEILNRHSVDLVHLHGVWNPAVIRWLAERLPVVRSDHEHSLHCPAGSKYFRTTGGICTHPYGPRCIWDALLKGCNSRRPRRLWKTYRRTGEMRSVEPCIRHFIVASQFVKDWLVRNGYPSGKISVLPYFSEFADQPHLSTEPGNQNRNTVLFVGRVVRQKGWREFLLALKEVRQRFRAVVNGDGPDLLPMKALTVRLGLADRVDYVGWLPRAEHTECYQRADVVVLPSVWPEPFGLVGIEAMSFGKPVIGFRVGGIPEWLEDGQTGFLVEPGNVNTMGDKISYLLEHPMIAQEMGAAGKERVRQLFSQEKHLSDLLQIYAQALG